MGVAIRASLAHFTAKSLTTMVKEAVDGVSDPKKHVETTHHPRVFFLASATDLLLDLL